MIAKEKNIKLDNISTQVGLDRLETKTTFKYKITLDDQLNDQDRDFLMNIIDFCTVKQTLSKQLEFVQHD